MQRNLVMSDKPNVCGSKDQNIFYCIGNLVKVGEVSGIFIQVKKYDLQLSELQKSFNPNQYGQLIGFKFRFDALLYTDCASRKDTSTNAKPGLLGYYANYMPIFKVKLKSVEAIEHDNIQLVVPTGATSEPIIEDYPCCKISVSSIEAILSVFYRSGIGDGIFNTEKFFTADESENLLNQFKYLNQSKLNSFSYN